MLGPEFQQWRPRESALCPWGDARRRYHARAATPRFVGSSHRDRDDAHGNNFEDAPSVISIKIKIIAANNYNFISHTLFHLLKILNHTLKYIFIIIYLQQILFCITPPCVFDVYLIELFICKFLFLSLPSYMNT